MVKIKILFLVCFTLISLSVNANKTENDILKKDPELIFKVLKHVFKLPTFFTDLFEKKSFRITEPSDPKLWKNISLTFNCTAIAHLISQNKTVELRFSHIKDIPTFIDYNKHGIVCNPKRENLNLNTSLPSEYRISHLIKGHKNFLNYIPDLALKVTKGNLSVLVFVNEYIGKLTPLDKYKADEKKLKIIFTKILKAIQFLLTKDLVYMTLVPSNILIDKNGEAYLTNLGSIYPKVVPTKQELCERVAEFEPPEFTNDKTSPKPSYWPRIQAWNFCRVIYSMVCGENSKINKRYDKWTKQNNTFIEFFKCEKNEKVSKEFVQLMDTCLVKPEEKFETLDKLNEQKWLKNA